jgi:hypothetical protein
MTTAQQQQHACRIKARFLLTNKNRLLYVHCDHVQFLSSTLLLCWVICATSLTCLQFSGAIFGALLVAGLVPGVSVGMGDGAPGCFDDTVIGKGLTHSQLFGWEVGMTFTLLSVVYACGVAKPGHGSFTPLAVGLSLVACAGTGVQAL